MSIRTWLEKNTERLDGKTVAVSGATGGLGGAFVELLAERGEPLILTGRSEEKLATLKAKLIEKFDNTFKQRNSADQETLYNSFNEFSVEVFNIINAKSGFGWIATGHTGDPVPLFAIGRGAYEFVGVHDNTDIPKKIKNIALGE